MFSKAGVGKKDMKWGNLYICLLDVHQTARRGCNIESIKALQYNQVSEHIPLASVNLRFWCLNKVVNVYFIVVEQLNGNFIFGPFCIWFLWKRASKSVIVGQGIQSMKCN